MNDRHARISALLLEALELPPGDRSAFLERECRGDIELRTEVESLLAQESDASDFLDKPILDYLAPTPPLTRTTSFPVERVATITIDAAAPVPTAVQEFSSIRHYRIVREIGRGGMGVVYEGLDEKLDRRVAIKAIHWDMADDGKRRDRFRQEARLLAALDHPNIGAIHSFEETEHGHFLILEFIEGDALGQLIGEAPLSVERTAEIARQVAQALRAAHDRGIVHRDLSPGNVMVRIDGVAKVLDFGLARSFGMVGGTETQSTGPIAGTPSFMSPELLHGAPSTRAADSWAFACLIYECLTGERAYTAPTLPGIFDRILNGRAPVERLPSDTPAGVRDVIERCWIKDPTNRLSDMGEIEDLLAETSDDAISIQAPRSSPRLATSWQPLARRVSVEQPLSLRLCLENPERRDVEVTVIIEPGGGWEGTDAARTTIVPPRSTSELFFPVTTGIGGSRRLPAIRVKAGDSERTVLPVPSVVEVGAEPRPTVYAREPETSQLEAWLDEVTSHPGEILVIRGPDGSGKSLLLDHAGGLAIRRGLRVVRAAGHTGLGEPLELMIDLVRSYLGIFEPLRDRDPRLDFARGRLREQLGESSPAIQYFLDLLRGAEKETLEGHMQQYRWYQLLSASAGSAPTVFLIDDIGRADSRSIELLASLLRHARSDGLAMTGIVTRESQDDRLESDGGSVDRLLADDLSRPALELAPLEPSSIDTLIEATFPGANHRDYVPELATTLLAHGGGQPGSVLETLRALARDEDPAALFQRSGPGWVVSADIDLEARCAKLPTGYDALIEERLDAVAESSWPTLEYAALLGQEFPVDPLENLVESEGELDDELDDALDDLERARIVEPADSGLTRYRFTHPTLSRQVASRIDGAGSRRAARLRRQVASALLDHFGESPSARQSEELGLRLLDLGEHDAALPHLLVALGRRVKRRQIPEANRVVRRIAEIVEQEPISDPSQQYEWLSLQGRTLILSGRLEAAESSIEEARQLAQRAGDRPGVLLSMVQLSEVAVRRGRFDAGRDLALAARESAREEGLDRIAAEAGRNLAVAYRRLGERSRAREIWSEDLDDAIAQHDALGELRGQNNLGIVLYEEREWEEAERRFERAASIARDLDHLEFEMIARVGIANIALARGELKRADEGYRVAIDAFRRLQNKRALSRNYYNLAQVEVLEARFEEAIADYERAVDLCGEIGDAVTEVRYRLDLANAALYSGNAERAREELHHCHERGDNPSPPVRLGLALLAERVGDTREVDTIADEIETAGNVSNYLGSEARSPEILMAHAVVLRSRPQRAEDDSFVRAVHEHLESSKSIGQLHERLQLAGALEIARGNEPTLDVVATWTGDELPKVSHWAAAVVRVIGS